MDYVKLFFCFFSVALGFTLHNVIAVLEGYFGKKSEFVRTPKFNIIGFGFVFYKSLFTKV